MEKVKPIKKDYYVLTPGEVSGRGKLQYNQKLSLTVEEAGHLRKKGVGLSFTKGNNPPEE